MSRLTYDEMSEDEEHLEIEWFYTTFRQGKVTELEFIYITVSFISTHRWTYFRVLEFLNENFSGYSKIIKQAYNRIDKRSCSNCRHYYDIDDDEDKIEDYLTAYQKGDLTEIEYIIQNVTYIQTYIGCYEEYERVKYHLNALGWWEKIEQALEILDLPLCCKCAREITPDSEDEEEERED